MWPVSPRHAADPAPRAVRHARRLRSHRVARAVALLATAGLSFGATGLAAAYVNIENNISTADISHLTGDRPQDSAASNPDDLDAGQPINLLVMGSDVRDGENATIGGDVEGMRSDTTILVHISAERDRVELVSIPRDSHVDIPECERGDGSTTRARDTRFNEAFSLGGQSGEVTDAAACTIRTVQSLTGVAIDRWVVVDFAGFISMVDALGGIPMCIPTDMRSAEAGLDITAGQHVLDGPTALALARARKGVGLGDGSDTGRVERQQQLLAATVNEVLSKNLLTDFPALYRFLTAATRSLTSDPATGNITTLAGLAYSLRGVPSGNIHFMTVPFTPWPGDENQVEWTSDADLIFERIAADEPVVAQAPAAGPTPTEGTDGTDGTEGPPGTDGGTGTDGTGATPDPSTEPTVDTITPDDVTTVCG
ncbi:transcriptional regulator [Cellulomonas carbonis]|nr:transcriptional regulator [Cellulomonas carbonis]